MSATFSFDPRTPDPFFDHWLDVSAYCDRWCERCRHRNRCAMSGAPLNGQLDPAAVPKPPPEVLEARARQLMEAARKVCEAQGMPVPEMACTPAPLFEDDPLMHAARAWRESVDEWLAAHDELPWEGESGRRLEVLGWHRWLVPGKIYWAVAGEHYRKTGRAELLRSHESRGQAKTAAMGLYACMNALGDHIEQSPLDQRALGLLEDTAGLLERLGPRFPNYGAFRRPGFDD